jgi:hypothetical protein
MVSCGTFGLTPKPEGDFEDCRGCSVWGARDTFNRDGIACAAERRQRVQSRFHARCPIRRCVEGYVAGRGSFEGQGELPGGGADADFLHLVDGTWRNIPSERLHEFAPGVNSLSLAV